MKVRTKDIVVGHWCRILWDDIGMVDGIIVEIDKESKRAQIYCICDDILDGVQFDQIIEVGNRLFPYKTGLTGYPKQQKGS